ncbi:DUF4198 domain-containing protein [Novosphingobium profundi]|uniref:DUF4198 domain-containing protein n=1 Tax=Novosphingobium profundi TaxID=1774954 RepID=UPI001BDAA4A9|nr:DUF4198 domain-containing protein [Novosphingobium profundi]MBT0669517.1 DUF4198 domain-containing protein [Novosphingobium profundi]
MLKKTLLLAASALAAASAPASAHNLWLLPSITVLSNTGQTVTVDAGASTHAFEPNHAAVGSEQVRVREPDGTQGSVTNAAKLANRAVFDVAIDKEGTWRIGMTREGISGRFKVNGEDWMVGGRRGPPPGAASGAPPRGGAQGPRPGEGGREGGPGGPGAPAGPGGPGGRMRIDPAHMVASVADIPAGATDLDLTESASTNEFFVTAGNPTPASFTPTGKGLEFVPETMPTDLVAGEAARFRFLVDGKPAAGLKVEVIPGPARFFEAADTQTLTTDANGVLTVTWTKPGFYWLNTEYADSKPSDSHAQKRKLGYTATLEVVAP